MKPEKTNELLYFWRCALGGSGFGDWRRDMGVKLEVFRMTLYLTFPVAMFWVANQAEWFEDYVIQRKRELWPPEKDSQRKELEEFKARVRKQREERLLRAAQQNS